MGSGVCVEKSAARCHLSLRFELFDCQAIQLRELQINLATRWTCKKKKNKTYSSGDSHVVTHRSTNPPVCSLSSGERTGSSVLCNLWP
ncbi:hypothetical protein K470DRAFT_285102 [Piedraia hortae CBS 480.64]|uniref:Uncharacterized protein n=1 Tax=Piedraia hortae CBS 480.64 TaxID=1314780 RepID=A0A6A7C2J2_9PEZI|nr:hypothetical protein K470DRAFT_285102 [Piedraia hortae CBS 480.64]